MLQWDSLKVCTKAVEQRKKTGLQSRCKISTIVMDVEFAKRTDEIEPCGHSDGIQKCLGIQDFFEWKN